MKDVVFAALAVLWIASGVGQAILLWRARAETKRVWHPRIVVASALIFAALMVLWFPARSPIWIRALFLAFLGLIVFLNIGLTRFCSHCGATILSNPPWVRARFCEKCGASLQPVQKHE